MMSNTRSYLIEDQSASGRMLSPLPAKHTAFQEQWLQEVLFKYPSILPVEELGDSHGPLVSLGREIANIDDLFISPSGLLTIVETKLWRNPEGHRTVVAQILDYAKTLTTWDYHKLDDAVKAYQSTRLGQPKSIYDLVRRAKYDFDLDEIEFEQRVQDGMEDGRFALLIVGDRIFPSAMQLADVVQSAPHLQFSLALVELRCFRFRDDSDWPLVVVPSVVARTREVIRAVVRVVYEEKKPEVEIGAPEEPPSGLGKTSLPVFIASLPSNIKDMFQLYLDHWLKAGYTVYWGEVGFSLRIRWEGRLVTVFEAYPKNLSILNSKHVRKYNLPDEPYDVYRSELGKSTTITIALASDKRYIKYEEMSEDEVTLVLECVDRFAKTCSDMERGRSLKNLG